MSGNQEEIRSGPDGDSVVKNGSIRALQNRLLTQLIQERIYPFSSYYRELFDRHGIDPRSIRSVEDLAEVPLTTKYDLMPSEEDPDRPRRFILTPRIESIREHWPLSKRLSLLASSLLRGKSAVRARLRREYYPIFMTFTTGRSAQPVPFFYSKTDIGILRESGKKLVEILGLAPDDKVLNLFPYAPHLAFWQVAFAGFENDMLVLSTGGGKVAGTEGNLRALSRMDPQAIVGVPGYVYHLLREAKKRNLRLQGLERVVLGADSVPEGLKRKLRELVSELGAENVDILGTYGFTEARMAFAECPTSDGSSSGYHIYPEQAIFELIDPETGESVPGNQSGELVYTPLNGRGTTVLRYRTGDLVQGGIQYGPCPHCGRNLPRIDSRLSRASSVTNIDLKKIKGTLVNMEQLGRILSDDADVEEWQVELRKKDNDPHEVDELVLHIAEKRGSDRIAIEKRIRHRMKAWTEVSPNQINFLSVEAVLERVGMEREMKERRYLDTRSTA